MPWIASHVNELLNTLNDLLTALGLSPPPLSTITELKPALLVSVLEAILRIPLSNLDLSFGSTSRSTSSITDEEELLDLQRCKLFLGVLEADVLEMDVGLSNIDPRRLARGKREELLLVAELLCWVGKRHNIISSVPSAKRAFNSNPQSPTSSPSTRRSPLSPTTTAVTTTAVCHSPRVRHSGSSFGTDAIMTSSPLPPRKSRSKSAEGGRTDISTSFLPPFASSPPPLPIRPRVIPETPVKASAHRRAHSPTSPRLNSVSSGPVPSSRTLSPPSTPKRSSDSKSSIATSPVNSPRSKFKTSTSVRYDGWISPVDEELELLSFETSRHHMSLDNVILSSPQPDLKKSSQREDPLEDLETARQTNLRLLRERARLLEELAKLGIKG